MSAIVPAGSESAVRRRGAAAPLSQRDADVAVVSATLAGKQAARNAVQPHSNPQSQRFVIPQRRSGHEALKNRRAQMHQVVPGREHHQRQHQRQPDAKTVFLRALRQGLATDRLCRIEQQWPPSSTGTGNRFISPRLIDSTAMNQSSGDYAALSNFARHLGDAQRPAELLGAAGPDDHLPDRTQRRRRSGSRSRRPAAHRALQRDHAGDVFACPARPIPSSPICATLPKRSVIVGHAAASQRMSTPLAVTLRRPLPSARPD